MAAERVINEPLPPSMKAYGRHVFICINGDCADPEEGMALQAQFLELNRQYGLNKLRNPERVKCTLSDCLGICSHGPIVVVYPDGIWYHHVDQARLTQIYEEHILAGRPVEAYIFHRLYPPGQEPGYAPRLREEQRIEDRGLRIEDSANSAPSSIFHPPSSSAALSSSASPSSILHSPSSSALHSPAQFEKKQDEPEVLDRLEPPAVHPSSSEIRAKIRKAKKKKGLVMVNTGNGKGKTTAALGVMTRAWGRKMRIGVIQFLKNENARFGEIKAVERMGDIDWLSTGDGWTWTSTDLDETVARARHGWEIAKARISSDAYDLFIMDEFTYPLHYGWLDAAVVIDWLKANKPPMLHLIITGRYAPEALIEYADLVTEMNEIKHPFKEQGIRAQAGIEY